MKKELELYEIVLLLNNTSDITSRIEFYRDFLVQKGSQVMVKNHGKVSLAYPIKGLDTATSIQLVYLGNGTLGKELNIEIQRDESVLRALTTKLMDQNVAEVFYNA